MPKAADLFQLLFSEKLPDEWINIYALDSKRNYQSNRFFRDGSDALGYAQQESSHRHDVYFGVALRDGDYASSGGRGRRDQCSALASFWLDLDVAAVGKKKTYFPDTRAIADWMQTRGIKPTALVASGSGGLHAYFLFDHIIRFTDPEHQAQISTLSESFQKGIAFELKQLGLDFDMTWNIDRILRVPDTINYKYDAPVVFLEYDPDMRYQLSHFERWLHLTSTQRAGQ